MRKQSQEIEQGLIEAIKNNEATISVCGTVRSLSTGRFVGKISGLCRKVWDDNRGMK